MSRVAICFSGLPRLTHIMTTVRWQQYIKKYNADVFIHTWILDQDTQKNTVDKLVSYFNPKVIKLESSRTYPLDQYSQRIWPTVIPYNVFSAYASIYESMKLANNYAFLQKFEYDYVIRARFDVLVDNLNLEPVEGIAVPDDPDKHGLKFKYRGIDLFGINDLVAYGNQKYMTLYSNVIKHMQDLYHGEGVDMCSELFLTSNLIRQNVPIVFRPFKTTIIRR